MHIDENVRISLASAKDVFIGVVEVVGHQPSDTRVTRWAILTSRLPLIAPFINALFCPRLFEGIFVDSGEFLVCYSVAVPGICCRSAGSEEGEDG